MSIRHSNIVRMLAAFALASGAAACGDSGTNAVAPVTDFVSVADASTAQVGTVGQPLSQAVVIQVTDANGTAVPSMGVTWSVTSGGGSIDQTTNVTDANGDALVHWTLGTTAGSQSITATISTGTALVLSATANAASMTTLAIVSADTMSVAGGLTTQPLVVKATDAFGNVVANAAVTWTATAGATLSSSSTNTDTNGLTQVTVQTGVGPATYTVTAAGTAGAPVTFVVNGT
jgi:adhesin/invasin